MIDVVLPVLDEADAIPGVLASLPDDFRAIVVDNGSTDGSADVARDAGATVVVEPQQGFGAACWAGLTAARSDVVCFMDCDGSFSGADLTRVAAPVVEETSDLVLGARTDARGWPLHARLANRALAWEIRRRVGVRLSDLGPMRAARRDALIGLDLQDRRCGWPLEMVLRAAAEGWRISEVPVSYTERVGRSKITGTVRGTARAVTDMGRLLR